MARGYGVTIVDGEGAAGPVKIIFTLLKRRDLSGIVDLINEVNPKAFYSVEDVRFAKEAIFPPASPGQKKLYWQFFRMDRKRK